MTQIFSTTFPVEASEEDIFKEISRWISIGRERQNRLPFKGLEKLLSEDVVYEGLGNDFVTKLKVDVDGIENIGLKYTHTGDFKGDEWSTEIVRDKESVGISLDFSSTRICPGTEPNKPVIVDKLSRKFGKGYDGLVPFKTRYQLLSKDDIPFIAEFLNGKGNNVLPIVYVSRMHKNNKSWIPAKFLAKKLSGIAHVFLEPYPSFARELTRDLKDERMACYNGAIRVYWPGSRSHLDNMYWYPKKFGNSFIPGEKMANQVLNYIIKETRFMSFPINSFSELVSANHMKRLNELRQKSDTSELEETFNGILEQYEIEHQKIKDENEELKRKLSDANQTVMNNESRIAYLSQAETSEWNDDMKGLALYVIEINKNRLSTNYNDRIERLLEEEQQCLEEFKIKREDHLNAFSEIIDGCRDNKGLNKKAKNQLLSLGYEIEEEGTHYKIYRNDSKGRLVMPKSTSDGKCGFENAKRDMRKEFF